MARRITVSGTEVLSNNVATVSVTIPSGQSQIAAAVDLAPYTLVGIGMSAGWDAAAITFLVGGQPVFDSTGAEVSLTVAAAHYVPVDPLLLYGVAQVIVRSGTSGTPVNQSADRVLTLYYTTG